MDAENDPINLQGSGPHVYTEDAEKVLATVFSEGCLRGVSSLQWIGFWPLKKSLLQGVEHLWF